MLASTANEQAAPKRSGRGGPRPGAGRKPSWPPVFHHVKRETFEDPRAAYITLRIRANEPSLRETRFSNELKRTVTELRERKHTQEDFQILRYSVRDDHLHFLITTTDSEALARGMKSLSARVVRLANRVFERTGPLLLGRYQIDYLGPPAAADSASVGCSDICRGPDKKGTHIRPGFEPSQGPR